MQNKRDLCDKFRILAKPLADRTDIYIVSTTWRSETKEKNQNDYIQIRSQETLTFQYSRCHHIACLDSFIQIDTFSRSLLLRSAFLRSISDTCWLSGAPFCLSRVRLNDESYSSSSLVSLFHTGTVDWDWVIRLEVPLTLCLNQRSRVSFGGRPLSACTGISARFLHSHLHRPIGVNLFAFRAR